MSKKGGGTTTSVQSIPKWVEDEYKYVVGQAKDIQKNTPFTPYEGEFVAPLSTTQQAGIQNVNQAQGMALPAYGYGMDLTSQAAQGVTPQFSQAGLDPYMSPYLNNVVGSTMANINEQNASQRNAMAGSAIQKGAYGGDRYGIQQAELARQQGLSTGQTIGNLYQSGYGQALGQYNQNIAQQQADQQRKMAAGQQFAQLGEGAQGSVLQGAQAQLMAGAQEQATRQALDQAKYNQFLQQQAYPFQTTSWLANIAQGIGSQSGGTSSTTAPSQSGVGSFLGPALTAASMFKWGSDERLKENIEPVGKTFDGQNIYKYNYKGEPKTQIGLIAQEVEHHAPNAVSKTPEGIRMVDYDTATEHAADRGHFASGGLVPMGFAAGGSPQFGMMPYVALANGLGYVPNANIPVGKSTIPKPPASPQQDSNAAQIAKGLQAMPQGAKNQLTSNVKGLFGPDNSGKIGYDAAIGPTQAGAPMVANVVGGSSGGFGDWLSGLFMADGGLAGGYASGGVVPRAHFEDGGPADDFEAQLARMRATTAAVESGNNPRITGKVIPSGPYAGDKAYGLYQVMGKNVPDWTEKALGRRMTPDEFLEDTEAQHAVYNKIAGDNLRKYGNIPDAASVWASGRPLSGNTTRDLVSGVPTSGYVSNFMKRMGESGDLGSIKNSMADTPLARGNPAGGFVIPNPPETWTQKGLGERLMDTEGAPRSLIERVIGSPLSDEARSGLLAAGLGMMASRGRTAGQQIGEGGLGGLQTYYNALANTQAKAKQEAETKKVGAETEKIETETGLTLATKLAEINRVRSIKKLPPINSLDEFRRRSADNTLFTPSPSDTTQPKGGQQKVTTVQQPAVTAPPAPLTAQTMTAVNDPNTQKAFQSIDWNNIADSHNIPMMMKQLQEFKAAGDSALTVDEMIKAREEEAKINSNIQNIINSRQLLTKDSQVISPPQWTDTANRLEAAKVGATKGAENIAEADKSYSDASQTRAGAYARIERVGQLLEAYQSGQLSDMRTQIPAIAAALGMKIDESKLNDRAYQEKFTKEATNMMFDQVKQLGARILVSELESAKMANVNPDLQPASNRQLLASAKGAMDAEKQFYQDYLSWREKNPTPSMTEFQRFKQQWLDDPSHSISKYVDAAAANMPTRGDLPNDPSNRKEGWQYVITPDKMIPEGREKFPKGAVATWDGKKWVNERPVK